MANLASWREAVWAMLPPAWQTRLRDNFVQRCIAGVILTVVSLWAVWGTPDIFPLYIWIFILVAVREWQRMTEPGNWHETVHYLYSVILLLAIVQMLFGTAAALAVLVILPFLLWLVGAQITVRHPVWFALSPLYLAPSALAIIHIHEGFTIGPAAVTYFFGVVWATDTAAYLIGRQMGGSLLAADISPKKTWSGFIGGLVAGVIVGSLVGIALDTGNFFETILVSAVLSVAAQASDLAQSAIKRYFSIKDTGGVIPGHGGVLDRIDSIMLSAPLYAAMQYLARHPLPW